MNKVIYFLMCTIILPLHAQQYIGGSVFGGPGIITVLNNFHDSSNNFYTVGLYNSPFTFAGVTYNPYGGNSDGFLLKYDANGNEVAAYTFGGNLDDLVIAGAVDANGNIYITGNFQGSGSNSFDADPGPGQYLLSTSLIQTRDCFIIKLDASGNFVWARQISNPNGGGNEDPFALQLDSQGNIYVAGRFVYADFDPSPNQHILQSVSGSFEGFVLKLDQNGMYQWVNHIYGAENYVYGLDIDDNDNVMVCGTFRNTINVDGNTSITSSGGFDSYYAMYDNAGLLLQSGSFGGSGNDDARNIIATPSGFAISGSFQATADLDPSGSAPTFTSAGGFDAYISQFDSAGNYSSSYVFGGTADDYVYDLIHDDLGNVYAGGSFGATVDFDNSTNTASNTVVGSRDVYTLIISQNNTYVAHGVNNSSIIANGGEIELLGNTIVNQGYFKTDVDLDPFSTADVVSASSIYKGYTSLFALTNLGTEDIQSDLSQLILYPNPAKDFIQFNKDDFKNYSIFDTDGKLVMKGVILGGSIDIHSLNTGAYLIQIGNDHETKTISFIKR